MNFGMAIGKRKPGRTCVVRARQIAPSRRTPRRNVRIGIVVKIAVVDAVGMFFQHHIEVRRIGHRARLQKLAIVRKELIATARPGGRRCAEIAVH